MNASTLHLMSNLTVTHTTADELERIFQAQKNMPRLLKHAQLLNESRKLSNLNAVF